MITLAGCTSRKEIRQDILLNEDWLTVANDTNQMAYQGFEADHFKTDDWERVDVPHNWDDYGGYRRMIHGNRHGYAWYRKSFKIEKYKRAGYNYKSEHDADRRYHKMVQETKDGQRHHRHDGDNISTGYRFRVLGWKAEDSFDEP